MDKYFEQVQSYPCWNSSTSKNQLFSKEREIDGLDEKMGMGN
jgi:hypothetical protein